MNRTRVLTVKDTDFDGDCVVYVMSRDLRAQDNHALLEAQQMAIEHKVPLYVLFVLKVIDARSYEHYEFMLDGLQELSDNLGKYNIPLVLRTGESVTEIARFADEINSGAIVFDFSPLQNSRSVIKDAARRVNCKLTVVDTHNIIPLWIASPKQEFAAHTMRVKVHKQLSKYLVAPEPVDNHPYNPEIVESLSFDEARQIIATIPKSGISVRYVSGERAAGKLLKTFIANRLETYAVARNDISEDNQSGLSPYLHFGQIASLRVVIEVMSHVKETPLLLQQAKLAHSSGVPSKLDGMNALLEELIVRKELADNFCFYSLDYKTLNAAPAWAQASLAEHSKDQREFMYNFDQFEQGQTHDIIWNAAQNELTKSGKMHGYMRMYWAKKILEWSSSPEEAVKIAILINDKYSIDGGDPNGYVGILWSIAGLHDRPWFERPVFGKVRYMNEAGLRRKFAVDEYINRIEAL